MADGAQVGVRLAPSPLGSLLEMVQADLLARGGRRRNGGSSLHLDPTLLRGHQVTGVLTKGQGGWEPSCSDPAGVGEQSDCLRVSMDV